MKSIFRTKCVAVTILFAACMVLLAAIDARADEIHVVTSGGFTAAYLELVPEYIGPREARVGVKSEQRIRSAHA